LSSCILKERLDAIAGRVTSLVLERLPDLEQRWKGARQKCTENNCYNLDYFCEALTFAQPSLFTEYAAWVASLLARLNVDGEWLALNLEILRTTLASELVGAGGVLAAQYLNLALTKLGGRSARIAQLARGNRICFAVRQLLIQREAPASCRLAQHARPVLTRRILLTQRRPLQL
jgi:hypothetical protein